MSRRSLSGILLACLLVGAGCSREEPEPQRASILTQGYRVPDDEGTVTEIGSTKVTLDDERTYPIDREVESFTSHAHKVTPLVHWKGKYVHLGLDKEDGVIWIAGIGLVTDDEEPRVYYTGEFERIDNRKRAIFRDGTTLKLREGVPAPAQGEQVLVEFDPATKEIIAFNR